MTHGADPDFWLGLNGQESSEILLKASNRFCIYLKVKTARSPESTIDSLIPVDAGGTNIGGDADVPNLRYKREQL